MSGKLVHLVRIRKRLQQESIPYTINELASKDLSRIEKGHQSPTIKTLNRVLGFMGLPLRTFFSPWLTNPTTDKLAKRDTILHLLDKYTLSASGEIKLLLKELKDSGEFEQGINLQFILSCEAQLNELVGGTVANTISMAKRGLAATTYNEFDEHNFEKHILIFEESNLLYTLACAYKRMGNIEFAISILTRIYNGISKLPSDDHEKEKRLAKVLLTLSNFQIECGRYAEALDTCEIGNYVSLKRNKGKYTPDFLYNKAKCMIYMGKATQHLFQLAYFGYMLLWKREQAMCVLKTAEHLGIRFNTYNTETLEFVEIDPVLARGESIKCEEIGTLIAILSERTGIKSQKSMYQGVCTQGNYSQIIANKVTLNHYFAEVFMQRLGRDINNYYWSFLSKDDFQIRQLRDEVLSQLVANNYNKAEELLNKLKQKKDYKKNLGLQFIKNAEATIFASRYGDKHSELLRMLQEAIKISLPDFDERNISHYRLTYYEILIINKMAIHYCEAGDLKRGLRMFEDLRDSMNNYYEDETEKIRMYPTVLYNLSKYLGRTKRHKEALELVDEAEKLSVKHGRLRLLDRIMGNKGFNLFKLGNEKESIPYLALAYYGAIILDETSNQQATADFTKVHLGIEFD